MENCGRRRGCVQTWGRGKEPPWELEDSTRARSGPGRRRAARALGAGSRRPARREGPAGAARATAGGGRGPGRLNKAGARGLGTHNKKLMSAAAWAAGSASRGLGGGGGCGGQGKGQERGRGGEEEGSAGWSAAATCWALLVPVAGRGGGSGKRSAWISQWEGKEREAGKGPFARSRENGRRGRSGAPPPPPHPQPPAAPTLELSRERRAPTPPLRLPPRVPLVLDNFTPPDHAPRMRWGRRASRSLSTRLGVVTQRSEMLNWVSAVRKEVGFNSGMPEFCSEGWTCHQSSAHCECPAKDDERLWSPSASIWKQQGVSSGWNGLGVVPPEKKESKCVFNVLVVLCTYFKTLN